MKRLFFIYNPNAGTGAIKTRLAEVVDIFVKAEYEVEVYSTQCYQDALTKVMTHSKNYDLLVCSGGDGTLDEVVTGIARCGHNVPIGYLPTGSANDFARSLQIPKNLVDAAEIAVNGVPYACDIGQFNEDYFVYIAAFGVFTDVSYETDQGMKNVFGHMAYMLEGAKRIFNVPSYQVRVSYEGGVIEDEFVFGMVTNSKSVGGFKGIIGNEVVFDDGLFEVTLIKRPKNPIELNEILVAMLNRQIDTELMYTFRTGQIAFESAEEIPWTRDGEFGGSHDKVTIVNRRKMLKIMVRDKIFQELCSDNDNEVTC